MAMVGGLMLDPVMPVLKAPAHKASAPEYLCGLCTLPAGRANLRGTGTIITPVCKQARRGGESGRRFWVMGTPPRRQLVGTGCPCWVGTLGGDSGQWPKFRQQGWR